MKSHALPLVLGLALAATLSPAIAADATNPPPVTHPSADTILRDMSIALGGAKQFSFRGTREIGATFATARNMQAKSDIAVTVQRPDKVVGVSTNSDGVRSIYFDGTTFTLLDGKAGTYSSVPMQMTLDELPAQLAAKYGFLPPLADFVISDPYKDMKHRSKSISYVGKATAGTPAVPAYRIRLAGSVADADMWIGVDDHLPRKLTATVRSGIDKGTALTIRFTDWNLAPAVLDSAFAFVPPKDAQKIPMVTVAEMQEAAAKGTAAKK